MSNIQDQFVTYWPGSKNLYVGNHTKQDPGNNSQHLIASMVKNKDNKYQAELKAKELIQSAKQIGSAIAVTNDSNLEHLQVIRLHEEIMGAPDQPFYLEQAATNRNVEMLESRESWRSIGNTVQRKNRLEETKEILTKFTEIKYDVTKLSGKTWTPIEDKLRTIKDPEAIDLQNLDFDFAYTRNSEIKGVIEAGITKGSDGGNTATALGDIRTPTTGFHSTSNIANAISAAIKEFRTRNRLPIDIAIFDVEGFDRFMANTWTGKKNGPNNIEAQHLPNGGVVDLPGFPGITAIIEPELDDAQKIYFLNKANALRVVQGPKLYRRMYDENKDAESVKMIDFVQFVSVDKEIKHSDIGNRYFSFQATYTNS